jgi:hypothetical protein
MGKNLSVWLVCRILYVEMKAKQKVTRFLFGFTVIISGVIGLFVAQPVFADCGGVQTSIINCKQTGVCGGKENPFEGTQPSTDKEKADYLTKYGHSYGRCNGEVKPVVNDASNSGVWGVLLLAINILTAGVGVAAVGGIVYGSLLYTSAGGSPEQVKKAVGIITNVVIGVIAYALMFSGLNFLIPGGLFN